jgi:hypothetical protein
MALNASGPISLGGSTTGVAIAAELALSPTAQISLNDSGVRTLAGVASGAIRMPIDFWGKSSGTPSWTSDISVNTLTTSIIQFDLNSTYTLMAMSLNFSSPPAGTIPAGPSNYRALLLLDGTTGNVVKSFKQATTASPNNSASFVTMDPNGNSYISHAYGPPGILLAKYNSSGVNQYSNIIASGGGSGTTMTPLGMVGDSSGNLYVSGARNTPNDDAYLNKVGPTGTTLWSRYWGNAVSTSPDTNARGVVLDESTNLLYTGNYNVFGSNPAPGSFKTIITVHNSSGVLQTNWSYWDSTNNRQLGFQSSTDLQLSKTNNFMLMGTYDTASSTRISFLTRLNKSTGAVVWNRTITSPNGTSFSVGAIGYCTDSSDNIYVAVGGSSAAQIYVLKYNSSGVLQWQRKLTKSGSTFSLSFTSNTDSIKFKDSGIAFAFSIITSGLAKGKVLYVKESDILANKVFSDGLTFSTTSDVVDTAGPTISMNTTSFPSEYGGTVGNSAGPSFTDITSSVSNIVYT